MTTQAQMAVRRAAASKLAQSWCELAPGHQLAPGELQQLVVLLGKHDETEVLTAMETAAAQYLSFDRESGFATTESATNAFSKVKGICFVRHAAKDDPNLERLFYIRGIARNNCGFFNDWQAMAMMKEVVRRGLSLDALTELALRTRNYTHFQRQILEAMDALPQGQEAAGTAQA